MNSYLTTVTQKGASDCCYLVRSARHEQVLRTTNADELNYRQEELSISTKGKHSTVTAGKKLRTPPPHYTP